MHQADQLNSAFSKYGNRRQSVYVGLDFTKYTYGRNSLKYKSSTCMQKFHVFLAVKVKNLGETQSNANI